MTRTRSLLITVALAAVLVLSLTCLCLAHGGHEHGHGKPAKTAILLVTFGTSVPEAQKVFDKVEQAYRKAFPDLELRWAYTAAMVRRIVAKKQGKNWLSPEEALAKLMADGFNQVAVQSLHVIPGQEFHDLMRVVQGFRSMSQGFKPLVSYPLCSTTDDLQAVAKVLCANLPAQRAKDQAVVFMGHGTHHPAGVVYPAMAYLLQKTDPLVMMGTVEGYPTLGDVVAGLKARKVKTAYLLPFMTVAGDHAMNDMAGDEPDSWKSVLTKHGIKPVPVLKAITELPAVLDIFIGHTRSCLKHFK